LNGGIALMVVPCHIASVERIDLETAKEIYRALGRKGTPDPALFDPEVEWHNDPQMPGSTVHRGVDAVMADIRSQGEAWEERRIEPVEVIETEDGAVVFVDLHVRGKASGAPALVKGAHVITLRDGLIVRVRAFIDRDDALRAAGVSGEKSGDYM
jgi:ketosteroid isomerase-like protein